MDNMLEENKNPKSQTKDPERKSLTSYGTNNPNLSITFSYNKTNKLISALYMVTDIMDKEEPLRNKLRSLGANVISDIYSFNKGHSFFNQVNSKVSEILSFLEIASSVGIISEMNCSILTKEFIELKESITETISKNRENWLEEFLTSSPDKGRIEEGLRGRGNSIGHTTRIGVQKGSTLLKALSRVEGKTLSKGVSNRSLDLSKTKRREEIVLIIKDKMKNSANFDGMTITDIKSNGHEMLASCGEKTLQRELISMVLERILKKTGEKRWSKYSLGSSN
jgi:hypothetical protein